MNREWWNGVLEACQAMRDGREAQGRFEGNWHKKEIGSEICFSTNCKYRAKPEPKLRPLTPQEWLEALLVGKTIGKDKYCFQLSTNLGEFAICVDEEYYSSKGVLDRWKMFSDGSQCGVEVIE